MTTNIKLVVIAEDGGNYQKLCGGAIELWFWYLIR